MLTLSDALGYTSIACWLGAQFPQVVENIRRQSCEGLALPFLANWLMGDISNLVGCLLTHQLPFQTYLATYFVIVDLMLVVQYFYYQKRSSVPQSAVHPRSSTVPPTTRRMSVDRGRYRTLSALASNMAAAAAIAAQHDEQSTSDLRRPLTRYSHAPSRRHRYEASASRASVDNPEDDDGEEDIPALMSDSFHSEGGRDIGRKRVSWSRERHGNRAASAGMSTRRTPVIESFNPLESPQDVPFPVRQNSMEDTTLANSVESLSQARASSRGPRPSRRGSSMVFLAVWALFGIGSFAHRQHKSSGLGQVLSSPIVPRDVVSTQSLFGDEPSADQILGRMFAWLCTSLYLTSRLPQIWKNYVRKSVEGLSMYLFIFAFLGNVFYVASILTSPRRSLPEPEATAFLKESIPYLLGSAGTLTFDVTIVTQSFVYRRPAKRHGRYSRVLDEEATGLLSPEAIDSSVVHRGRPTRPEIDTVT